MAFNKEYLDNTHNSWIIQGSLPLEINLTTEQFDELWLQKPKEQGKIRIFGMVVTVPRWHQSYLQPYIFSGVTHQANLNLPNTLKTLLKWVNELEMGTFNQILVNWYKDGTHYIGRHSDDETQLITNSPIISMSFGATRTFRIRKKGKDTQIMRDISLHDGTYIIMGDTQN